MNTQSDAIVELTGEEIRHCTAPFWQDHACSITNLETLPYNELKGPGLERLCYQLMLSFGDEPHYFGRSGQSQPEADLVVVKSGRTEKVVSCKNLDFEPSSNNLTDRLAAFEKKWLAQGLPQPLEFVIFWPQRVRDTPAQEEWERAQEEFKKRTGVAASYWDIDLINGWLKKRPDIVADLFSNRHAMAFCEIEEWNPDLFIPVCEGAVGDLRLRRYFDHRLRGRLYLDQGYEQQITEALENSPVILGRGLPGTGKTFTSLAVAEGFQNGRWRTYFLNVGDSEFNKKQMREGIRRRMSRPSIFILENCHEKLDDVEEALWQLKPEMASRRVKIICLARRVPGPEESRSDESAQSLFSELEAEGVVVEFSNTDKLMHDAVVFWNPAFKGLSKQRLTRLYALSGRDLLLLDFILGKLDSPTEIDTLSADDMYDWVRNEYFRNVTVDKLVATRRLAALAQFEIEPRADILEIPNDEYRLIESFCILSGRPPRWCFLHSSASELILHSLWAGMGVRDPVTVGEYAATAVIDYFSDIQSDRLTPPITATALESDLIKVLRGRLKLASSEGENRLKAAVLDSEPVRALLPKLADLPTFPRTVSWCTFHAYRVGASFVQFYAQQLYDSLKDITETTPDRRRIVLPLLGLMLHCLKHSHPSRYDDLMGRFGEGQFIELIEANGTVFELFMILANASSEFASSLLDSLDGARVERLIKKTIAAGRSIGTLHLAMRELHSTSPKVAESLEQEIGAARFLELIEANGTIFELFLILQYTSPEFASSLLESLNVARVEHLIKKTIAAGRSIGTLNFALRELHSTSPKLAVSLEQKIGAGRFLKLIEANGTIFELFRIIQDVSLKFASSLIDYLNQALVENLIKKTIAASRSIGTLNFTLRKLHSRSPKLAKSLEQKVGVDGFWALLIGTGTPGPLTFLALDMSPDFQRHFLAAAATLSQQQWSTIINHGDFFQLCRLIKECPMVFAVDTGGNKLQAAIAAEAAELAKGASWYARNSGVKLLTKSPDSEARAALLQTLDDCLIQIDIQTLSFPSLSEAVYCTALLYDRRPELRIEIADRLWDLLPPAERWQLDPKREMALPKLLTLVARPEFSDEAAERVRETIYNFLTRRIMEQCRTVDLLWTLWALFAFTRQRHALTPSAFIDSLPTEFIASLQAIFDGRATAKADREELRARFALAGLLSMFGQKVDPMILDALAGKLKLEKGIGINADWLCADQGFVTTFLLLRGLMMVRPFPAQLQIFYLERLLSLAAECPEMDSATEDLYLSVSRQAEKLRKELKGS